MEKNQNIYIDVQFATLAMKYKPLVLFFTIIFAQKVQNI
jgi:hypothetical protein